MSRISTRALLIIICVLFVASAWAEITPLSIAQSQIGLGEIGGNNRGYYVRQYLNGKENLPWCAGFISYCFKRAGYPLQYFLNAKSYLRVGKKVNNPQPGDLIIFSRKGGGHIAIIEKVDKNGITTIEANLGAYPSKIKRVVYKEKPKQLLAYISIERIK